MERWWVAKRDEGVVGERKRKLGEKSRYLGEKGSCWERYEAAERERK
jgi:hypothetical protein